jgi:LAO/AO transport system kinase
MNDASQLVKRLLGGDPRALARALTLVEAGGGRRDEILSLLPPPPEPLTCGVIGITGLPGSGKSQLIDHLIQAQLERGEKVGVVAVDPSSPVHGGALLGDRIRWMRHATTDRVMIRSLASRGSLGGLNPAVAGVVRVLQAVGCRPVFVETVGLGQIGCDIREVAQIIVAVLAPGLGDEVQMMKSGLVDVVDLLVLNKMDLPGSEVTLQFLSHEVEHRRLTLLQTSASTGRGVPELAAQLQRLLAAPPTGRPGLQPGAGLEARILEHVIALVRPLVAAKLAGLRPPESALGAVPRLATEALQECARRLPVTHP